MSGRKPGPEVRAALAFRPRYSDRCRADMFGVVMLLARHDASTVHMPLRRQAGCDRQVERLKNYAEIKSALRRDIEETHGQRDRLEEALTGLVEKPSAIKEDFLGMVGYLMAFGHTPARDEILKNTFANQAF